MRIKARIMMISILLLFFFLALSTAHAEPKETTYILVIAESANLYAAPSTDSETIRTVTKGIKLKYFGETNQGEKLWYQVQAQEGKTGYIKAEDGHKTTAGLAALITIKGDESTGGQTTTTVTRTLVVIEAENKSIYTAADESSQALGTVAKGLSFEVLEEKEGWYKINFGASPGWITREGTSKIIEKETQKTPARQEKAQLIVTWQKPDDNAPGFYWGYEIGALVYGLYGSWKTWADSENLLVDDSTNTQSISTDPALSVSTFPGYKWNRFVFGVDFGMLYGRFDIEHFSSRPTYIVMRGGPRVRYFFLHDKWRPFADVMAGYAYSMVYSDSFDDVYVNMDHYTLGFAGGIVYHKVSSVDFSFGWAKSWDVGFMFRTDFFGPLKSKQIAKSSEMEVRAAYGWMPVGLYLTFGNQF